MIDLKNPIREFLLLNLPFIVMVGLAFLSGTSLFYFAFYSFFLTLLPLCVSNFFFSILFWNRFYTKKGKYLPLFILRFLLSITTVLVCFLLQKMMKSDEPFFVYVISTVLIFFINSLFLTIKFLRR